MRKCWCHFPVREQAPGCSRSGDHTLKLAWDYFNLQRERDELLREKLSVTYSTVIADRIMMLGLIGVVLNDRFRRAPSAVRSYLRFVGAGLRRDSVSIQQLGEVSVWERYHRKAVEEKLSS